jgi:NitT/TauT family transport system substrate-binding protein
VVRLNIGPSLGAAAQLLALDRGYFQQEGLTPQRVPALPGGNTKLILAALLSGQADAVGVSVDAGLFNAGAAGAKIVGSQARQDPGAGAGLVVRKQLMESGRVKTRADLKGLRIGIPGHGNPSEFELHEILESAGLSLSDVQLSTLDFPTMSSALANDVLDVGFFAEPFATQLVDKGVGVKWQSAGEDVPGMQTTVLMFSPRLLNDHDLSVRTMMAYLRGARDYNDAFFKNKNRPQVVQELIEATAIKDPKLYDQMGFAVVDPNGQINVANVRDQLTWYEQMGYVTQKVDLSALYDASIAREAVARLGVYR